MNFHPARMVRSACAAAALVFGLAQPADGVAAVPAAVQTLIEGRLAIDPTPLPPADPRAGAPIRLPDPWSVERPTTTGFAWYTFDWTLAEAPETLYAIYLPGTNVHAQVFVNDTLVGTTGDLARRLPQSWERSQAFALPFALPRAGANRIDVRVFVPRASLGGLEPIVVGPAAEVRRIAFADLFVHSLGPMLVSATIVVVGLFILMLWVRRRDPAYGLFSLAAILWGVHTALTILPEPPLPDLHWPILWHGIYMAFVALLCLFCLRFTGVDWPLYRRVVIAFGIAVVPALYIAWPAGFIGPAAVAIRAGAIGLVLVALGAVARYAIAARNTESALLLLAGAVSVGFGIHDWIAANDPYQIREVWLVPYAALAFLVLVGWILVDRFVRALNDAERTNLDLERRVAEKSVELVEQLARTREARDAAETANRAKSRFLAAASHDLRQPLHALGLFAAKLPRHVADDEGARIAERVQRSVASLEELLSSLLDVSRLDAGVIEARPQPVPLDAIFERIADVFVPPALERGIKLAIVPTRLVVRSDPVLLERIVANLAANAIKVTARGGVVIGARRRGPQVAIEVRDSGPGVPAAERERIFEEFYPIDNPERDRSRGLGLGLAIVRRLASLLGHRIEVDSEPGRGSVFRVVAERVRHGDAEVAPAPTARAPDATLAGRRIVVVEDDEAVRAAMVDLLEDWGCESCAAADARTAHAMVAARVGGGWRPDALVVDYRLPNDASGLDAIAGVRSIVGADVPALVVTGASAPDDVSALESSGFVWLSKPVAPAKLRAALAYLVSPRADRNGSD